jgi:hypothetical protein
MVEKWNNGKMGFDQLPMEHLALIGYGDFRLMV